MSNIIIEPACEKDLPAMMELLEYANMHYIPSEEMEELDWHCFFVAKDGDRILGLSGYKILSSTEGKTTLMVVHPDCRGLGIGIKLQTIRIEAMAARGVKKVTTNADLPKTIAWYKKHFGYREVGRLKKLHEFGDPSIYWWTTLEMDLDSWAKNRYSV